MFSLFFSFFWDGLLSLWFSHQWYTWWSYTHASSHSKWTKRCFNLFYNKVIAKGIPHQDCLVHVHPCTMLGTKKYRRVSKGMAEGFQGRGIAKKGGWNIKGGSYPSPNLVYIISGSQRKQLIIILNGDYTVGWFSLVLYCPIRGKYHKHVFWHLTSQN